MDDENWQSYIRERAKAQWETQNLPVSEYYKRNVPVQNNFFSNPTNGIESYTPSENPNWNLMRSFGEGMNPNGIQLGSKYVSTTQDPNFLYQRYVTASNIADWANDKFKAASSDAERASMLSTFNRASDTADAMRAASIQAEIALNRQKSLARVAELGHPDDIGLIQDVHQSALEHLGQNTRESESALARAMFNWNERMKRIGYPFENKGGYLLEGAGTLPMAGDIGRLVSGGGVGIDEQGNPAIRSKAEIKDTMPIPEEFQNSYTNETPDEVKAKESRWAQEDLDTRNKKMLLKSVNDANTINSNIKKSQFWGEFTK